MTSKGKGGSATAAATTRPRNRSTIAASRNRSTVAASRNRSMAYAIKGKGKRAAASVPDPVSVPRPMFAPSYYLKYLVKTRPDIARTIIEYGNREIELLAVHADIHKAEDLFHKNRNEWVICSRTHYVDKDKFFEARCDWELYYKKQYLHPLYERIKHIVATSDFLRRCFWFRAMLFRKNLFNLIKKALEFLKDIECSRTSNYKGFKLKFTFDKEQNPYFSNEFLIKTYEVSGYDNNLVYLLAIGDEIEWKPSHNLTEDEHGRRVKSFFNFFESCAYSEPLSFDIETDKLVGDDVSEDYQIGITIRDVVIPHAAYCFYHPDSMETEDGDDSHDDYDGW